jgi:hypothetical protein
MGFTFKEVWIVAFHLEHDSDELLFVLLSILAEHELAVVLKVNHALLLHLGIT